MKMLLPLALVASLTSLAACTSPRPAGGVAITSTVDRAEAGYAKAKAVAEFLLPFLSVERAAQIRMIQRKIEASLATARAAATLAEQLKALDAAQAATVQLDQAAGTADWIILAAS